MSWQVALIEPDIPANTGTIARLCLATGSTLHLVGRLGFHLDDRQLKRAGLDYWRHVDVRRWTEFADCRADCRASCPDAPIFYFSAHAERCYTEASLLPGALLVFGSETRGLPQSMLDDRENCWQIPIFDDRVRSLNLATAVAIVLYEAVRQKQQCGE